jgi:tetratricopeptide (TPR) repeat protein
MNLHLSVTLVILFSVKLHALGSAHAASTPLPETQTSPSLGEEAPIGADLRPAVVGAIRLIQARRIAEAGSILLEVCPRFESRFQPGTKYVAVDSPAELQAYRLSTGSVAKAVDFSYALCLQSLLYVHSEQGNLRDAQPIIDRIVASVPTLAAPYVEIGFLLNKHQRYEDSVKAYEMARTIALAYPPQTSALAKAMRGIGANRIDQGRFEDAEIVYRQSLQVEPANDVALRQLEYIKRRK